MSAPGVPGQPKPLQGGQLAITSFAVALGTFMQVLDLTIANASLPTIAGNLGSSVDQGTWVITAFAVSNGISVPLTGWLMKCFGRDAYLINGEAMHSAREAGDFDCYRFLKAVSGELVSRFFSHPTGRQPS